MLCVLAIGIAVVTLRWHYPTDALGGAAVGIAIVMLADGFLRLYELRKAP